MKLVIKNDEEVRSWLQNKMFNECILEAIKGAAPIGATYDDGDPITNQINIGWRDINSNDAIYIQYKLVD